MRSIDAFVVQTRSQAPEAWLLAPASGVIASAWGTSEGTSASLLARSIADEVVDAISLGLVGDLANRPGLAKYAGPDPSMEARLVASFRLANERLRAQHRDALRTIEISAVAIHVAGGRAICVAAGAHVPALHFRSHDVREIAASCGTIGASESIAPDVVTVDVEPGDLLVLGIASVELRAILAGAGALDRRLADCAESLVIGHPLLVARVAAHGAHSP